jgi:arylsulfatase A-like enzyme
MRFGFILVILLLVGRVPAQLRPNIIFIMADDLGYGDLSCYGSRQIATPNLDRLAGNGIRLTQAYAAAPMCTPSRTAFMTGRYPARTPVGLKEPLDWTAEDYKAGLSPQTPSLPALLRRAGYHTRLIGKWHLGFAPAFSPLANGFDYFFGYLGGGVDYISHTDPEGRPDLYQGDSIVNRNGYLTDLFAEDAIRFLRKEQQQPFFLSIQFSAPHWPWQERGDKKYPKGNSRWKEGGSPEKYGRMVSQMDEAIGRIMEALHDSGLDSNTLVVFTSDNGGERFSDMGGLKEKKFLLWEGGIRVPAIACWPGKIAARQVSAQPLIHMDWTTSFLSLAGASPDPGFPLDGMDILPLLRATGPVFQRTFYWRVFQRNQQQALRRGTWKYLKTESDEYLFNIDKDPFEENNLRTAYPALFRELRALYESWEKTVPPPKSLTE